MAETPLFSTRLPRKCQFLLRRFLIRPTVIGLMSLDSLISKLFAFIFGCLFNFIRFDLPIKKMVIAIDMRVCGTTTLPSSNNNKNTRTHTPYVYNDYRSLFCGICCQIKWKSLFNTIDFPYKGFYNNKKRKMFAIYTEGHDIAIATNLHTSFPPPLSLSIPRTHTHALFPPSITKNLYRKRGNRNEITSKREFERAHQLLASYRQQSHLNKKI